MKRLVDAGWDMVWLAIFCMVIGFMLVSIARADDPLRSVRPDPLRAVKIATADPVPKKARGCPCGCDCKTCACQQGEPCDCGCMTWYSDGGDAYALFRNGKQVGYLSASGTYWKLTAGNGYDAWEKWKCPLAPPTRQSAEAQCVGGR